MIPLQLKMAWAEDMSLIYKYLFQALNFGLLMSLALSLKLSESHHAAPQIVWR